MNTPSPAAASPLEQATACVLSEERLAWLVGFEDIRSRELENGLREQDAEIATALRELQRLRAGGSALRFTDCVFIGPAPKPFIAWNEWANHVPHTGVTIQAIKPHSPATESKE